MNQTLKQKSQQAVVIGGLGVVGKATRELFGIDDYFDLNGSTLNLEQVAKNKRYIFLCLPTPVDNNGYKVESIFEIIKQIEQYPGGQHIFINRSTVIPGTTAHINKTFGFDCTIHNPEFLTMRTIKKDIKSPDIVVIGADERLDFGSEIMDWYGDTLKNDSVKYFLTKTKESELIKLAINNFYALKVVFANQIYDICEQLEIDYKIIRDILYARKWIGKNHLDVWHDNKRGFSGMCLPKDNKAFNIAFGKSLFKLVEQLNEEYLSKPKK